MFASRGLVDVVAPGPQLEDRLAAALQVIAHVPRRSSALDLGGLARLTDGLLGPARPGVPLPYPEALAA
jgi:hypothetical protein